VPDRPGGVGSRREARERALGLLYEAEAKDTPATEVLDAQPIEVEEYAADVVTGVADHRDALDEIIGRHARGWTIARMPALDRTILRMASYELCHRPDVPPNVIINEAVELAKRFSTDDSGRFVNGVLAAVASEQRGR
jgi:N utilization substance protein B